jgi:hypothetical protein
MVSVFLALKRDKKPNEKKRQVRATSQDCFIFPKFSFGGGKCTGF